MVDGLHNVLGESASEAGEGGMIGSEVIHGELQELFKGAPIVDLGFQLGIGIDVEPLLQKQAFQKQEGMVGLVAIHRFEKGDVGEGEAGHFFEAHISSKGVNLEEIWHKSEGMSSNN